MRILENILIALAVPVTILNALGAIVGGIWLAFLGEWTVIFSGLIYMFLSSFVIGLALAPGLLLVAPLAWFVERKNLIGVAITGTFSLLYTFTIMIFSSYYIFSVIVHASDANIWALLLWAFSAAVTPWAFMASKEQDNEGTIFSLATLNYALIIASVLIGVFAQTVEGAFTVVSYFMLIPLVPGVYIAVKSLKNRGQAILSGEAANSTEFTIVELETFVSALLYLAQADDDLHPGEITEISQCFASLTKEGISKKFIRRIYDGFQNEPLTLDHFKHVAPSIGPEMRRYIAEGMCYVARSDGKLHEKERKIIVNVSSSLGLSKPEIATIYREAITR